MVRCRPCCSLIIHPKWRSTQPLTHSTFQEAILTDLENLQTQDNPEQVEEQRQLDIIEQITDLFQQLSPEAQEDLLDVLAEDEDLDDEDDDA
ncbi:MAG: hypothetical protein KME42_19750 [Tildeniella nuda ZEHNDER 1965/U140]|nr:hypothetical protein [Tildeniella nuda ZEHNDER 1965/U140]